MNKHVKNKKSEFELFTTPDNKLTSEEKEKKKGIFTDTTKPKTYTSSRDNSNLFVWFVKIGFVVFFVGSLDSLLFSKTSFNDYLEMFLFLILFILSTGLVHFIWSGFNEWIKYGLEKKNILLLMISTLTYILVVIYGGFI